MAKSRHSFLNTFRGGRQLRRTFDWDTTGFCACRGCLDNLDVEELSLAAKMMR